MSRLLLTAYVGVLILFSASRSFSQVEIYTPFQSPVSVGQTITVPVLVKGFQNIIGIQFATLWDSTVLKYQSVQNFNLPNVVLINFGLLDTSAGRIRFNWYDGQVTKTDGDYLFKIKLKVIGAVNSSTSIEFGSILPTFPVEIISNGPNGSTELQLIPHPAGQIGVGFTIATNEIPSGEPAAWRVFPNPFSEKITVQPVVESSFSNEKSHVVLTDIAGRVVFETTCEPAGMEIATDELGLKGIYFLTISDNQKSLTRKLVSTDF